MTTSGPLRSKQGCWTCRLRKKKCDEAHPVCSLCESLSIACYGYGPRPEWMDSGEREKAVADGLKEIVKLTWKGKAKRREPTGRGSIKQSKVPAQDFTAQPQSNGKQSSNPQLPNVSSQYGSNPPRSTGTTHPSITEPVSIIPVDETNLMMHFLDIVFPLQFPMYKPRIGGRGWLLALLLRSHPVYHAALALSLYYQRMVTLATASDMSRVAALVQQEKHLEICIELLKQAAENLCAYKRLGEMSSMVQLMFLELFTGQSNAWQAHLGAVLQLYLQGYDSNFALSCPTEKARAIIHKDLPHTEYEAGITEQVVSLRFLGGALVWLDIISSITTGTAPDLLPCHSFVLGPGSQTRLEDTVGCENWVLLQMGRIAALYERRTKNSQERHIVSPELELMELDIKNVLQHALTQATPVDARSDQQTLLTYMYTHMAVIYLHLVTHGFSKLEDLSANIFEAMRLLQNELPTSTRSALVAPVFIIGSVARRGEEQFFRNVFSSPPLINPFFQHRGRILPILEEIWRRRQTRPDLMWGDCLELMGNILLI
ncbi:hypothetical protein DL98DRAFT_537163 [Cadophora sp. DSE1049]|nr:hypothetical protein DL98DRAFT_537163 [Cadophora sp. DSE1049]